ncbi:ABC transporter permease [Brenneria corticis]|uniref:ABC transporter permease n=1 Tax=Brenneria corticis TaxID=2173106 RepID=A0A2U1UD54_9GAMM|nr:ABC transporter permease [Brenneria sp. CFCC 11842]PWC19504.1 ABC transporter permease [Brenneria sp. CFCC 11842]
MISTDSVKAAIRKARRRPIPIIGFMILVLYVIMALSAKLIWPNGPWLQAGAPYTPPFAEAALPFGTDNLGRDVMAMLAYGARISLIIGAASTLAATVIGVVVGATAGYSRQLVDDALMRITEVFQTIPSFIFVIVLVVIFSPSITTITFAIATVSWPPVARLVRAEFISLRSRVFVQSCQSIGMSPLRIAAGEILPNCFSSVIVMSSVMVATAVLIEAGLSFLGLGDPNMPSWGGMVSTGRPVIRTAPYLTVIPGLAIFLMVLAINVVGEGLNDHLNPRLRNR